MFYMSLLAFLHCTFHCTVAVKNIRNMHAVSTNEIKIILHFYDKVNCLLVVALSLEAVEPHP